MDFGKVSPEELEKIKFKLPADPEQTTRVLSKAKKTKTPKVMVGCAKWGRPDWVGKIYPKGTKAANFLDEYAKQFKCIEFNAIYYRLPTDAEIEKWISKVPGDFIFCPKFSDVITHVKRLKNADQEVNAFLDVIYKFGKHIGPVFLMPHPQMGAKHLETIQAFAEGLPKEVDLFIEYRHKEWYETPHEDTIFNWMEKKKIGSVITDTAGRRDCAHMRLTTPHAFIRFVGNSLHASDYKRIDDWVNRIDSWLQQGLESCYFFMHQHEELYSPELSKYLIEKLNKKCGLDIPVPKFTSEGTLF